MRTLGEQAGANPSFWERTVQKFSTAPLEENVNADVCVIGGGIAGVTTAYRAARENRTVVLIDDGPIGGGMTGRTTAQLVNAIDDRYIDVEKFLGEECARLTAESHTAAIAFAEQIVREHNIECDFERLDGYLFLPPGGSVKELMKELEAIHRVGLRDVERVKSVPNTNINSDAVLRFPRQAQFHPLKYLNGLARVIVDLGGRIFTGTRVVAVEDGDRVEVKTSDGHSVTARAAVVATNCPINDRVVIHSKQAPVRDVRGLFAGHKQHRPRAFLGYRVDCARGEEGDWSGAIPLCAIRARRTRRCAHGRRRRSQDWPGLKIVPSVSPIWNVGRATRFPFVSEITDHWSGQVMEAVDGVAYIGRNPGDKNVYVVTGDSGNGITHGILAGTLIVDLIAGRENPWANLYDPSRKTLQPRVLADYIVENANVAAQFRDYVTPGSAQSVEEIETGQGALLRHGLKKIAVYRDDNGTLHAFSAVCPHLQCVVRWNACEKTWDCPCHGSRFDALGCVLNGPAVSDLKRAEVPEP